MGTRLSRKTTYLAMIISLVMIIALLSGCAGNGDEANETPPNKDGGKSQTEVKTDVQTPAAAPENKASEPVTLTLHNGLALDAELWEKVFVEPLKERFPHITLVKIDRDGAHRKAYENLLLSGAQTDILFTSFGPILPVKEMGLMTDMSDLIKKYGLDMTLYKPEIIQAMQTYADPGVQYGLPLYMNVSALFYNKDLFDRFNVDYPMGNMTFDEAIELGKQMTRMDGDEHIIGYHPTNWTAFANGLSLPLVDKETETAVFDKDPGWFRVMDYMKKATEATDEEFFGDGKANNRFFNDQTIAMLPGWLNNGINRITENVAAGSMFEWDIVPAPMVEGFHDRIGTHFLMISPDSKHRDEAFEAMAYLTSSKEVQSILSRMGRVSSLNDPEINAVFGETIPFLEGKNTATVIERYNPGAAPYISPYDDVVRPMVNQTLNRIVKEGVDINTALREATEAANLEIKKQKGE